MRGVGQEFDMMEKWAFFFGGVFHFFNSDEMERVKGGLKLLKRRRERKRKVETRKTLHEQYQDYKKKTLLQQYRPR